MTRKIGLEITKILKVDSQQYLITLRYADGFVGEVDLSMFFNNPKGLAAEILKGNMFSKCFVESGALAWSNGLEFCPDAVRQWIHEKQKKKAA